MRMDITWKTANLTLIGPFAIAIAGLNSAESSGVARSARLIDCNIRDPHPCVDSELGYPAGDLLIVEGLFDPRKS
jgi:hypothetical protein